MTMNVKPVYPKMILPVPIGYSRRGLIVEDLVSFPHLLIAGQTFGGKSNLLHQILISLTRYNHCRLFIIDMKRLEFESYRGLATCAFNMADALDILEYLRTEMFRRLQFLADHGCVKIQDYDGRSGPLPYLVLAIDEMSQLSPAFNKGPQDKKMKMTAHSYLVDLLCLARCVGIHVIVCTQRPDKDILPGQLKANIPATVCFKVRNDINSRICLDHERAAYLPMIKGRGIYQFHNDQEIQTMFVDTRRLKDYLYPIRSVVRSAGRGGVRNPKITTNSLEA